MKKELCCSVLFLAASLPFPAAEGNVGIETAPLNEEHTLRMKGKDLKVSPGKTEVSFIVDGSNISFSDGVKFFFSKESRAALIFKDSNQEECPFTDLETRKYTLEKTNISRKFRVTTTVTPEEIDAILDTGCLITTKPDMSALNKEQRYDDILSF